MTCCRDCRYDHGVMGVPEVSFGPPERNPYCPNAEPAAIPDVSPARTHAHDLALVDSQPREKTVDKLLLTTTEAADALGICRSKLYELLRAGRLESVRIDGSRRVPAAVLEEFVSRLRAGAVNG